MKRTSKLGFWLVILGVAACATAVPHAHAIEKAAQKRIVQQARKAYYSLHERSFAGAQADIRPQWQITFKALMASNPTGAQVVLERLKGLHFSLSLDSSANGTLTHLWDPPVPSGAETTEGYQRIYAEMDQTVSGFFQT